MTFLIENFTKDILDCALEHVSDRSILIFPTRAAAEIARMRYEPRWNLEEIHWLTMEDFKRILLAQNRALAEDEKRLLSLWQVLTEEDKAYFHFSDYADIVEWGTNFFAFMMEFREAGRALTELKDLVLDPQLYIRAWQEEHINRMDGILNRYQAFLDALNMSDAIFCPSSEEVEVPWRNYRIIFVNQFYFSHLEQALARSCEGAGNEVLILSHEVNLKQDNWQMPEFEPENSPRVEGLAERIQIFECDSEEQAALAFLVHNQPQSKVAIIDSTFHQKPYRALFPNALAGNANKLPISQTRLFQVISFLVELASSQEKTPEFIPLSLIMRFCLDDSITPVLVEGWSSARQEKLNREVFRLADEDVILLDLNPEEQFPEHPGKENAFSELVALGKKLFPVVRRIVEMRTLEELIGIFSGDFDPESLASPQELEKTDILEQFWTSLANFQAIRSLGVVKDWGDIFRHPGIGIFKLWHDFLKSKNLKLQQPEGSFTGWEITNLLDARNRSFERIAILQAVEGVLPQSPGSVWLLNESQRARLGLLSYETIRNWERYYFFRLILASNHAQIYCFRNLEQNQKPSSFVGELLQIVGVEIQKVKIPVDDIFRAYLAGREKHLGADEIFHASVDESFCTLPSHPERDFGEKREIRFGSYDINMLSRNPFVWYIQSLRKIRGIRMNLSESLSPALFGTLMHYWFAEILGKEPSFHKNTEKLRQIFTNDVRLRQILSSIIHCRDFIYKLPKNYNEEFLNGIISDCLVASLKEFYFRFLEPYLAGKQFELIPEGSRPVDEEHYKLLTTINNLDQDYHLKIKGRADLRINTPAKRYIVDFKTGSADATQLIFYEWYYELIDHPDRENMMESYFWMMLERRINSKETVKPISRKRFATDIGEQLLKCMESGYGVGKRSSDRDIMKNITRSDLILAKDAK